MPKFEVHYSFTCSECKGKNDSTMEVLADDRLNAYQCALEYIRCIKCKAPIDQTQTFTTSTKEIKEK